MVSENLIFCLHWHTYSSVRDISLKHLTNDNLPATIYNYKYIIAGWIGWWVFNDQWLSIKVRMANQSQVQQTCTIGVLWYNTDSRPKLLTQTSRGIQHPVHDLALSKMQCFCFEVNFVLRQSWCQSPLVCRFLYICRLVRSSSHWIFYDGSCENDTSTHWRSSGGRREVQ